MKLMLAASLAILSSCSKSSAPAPTASSIDASFPSASTSASDSLDASVGRVEPQLTSDGGTSLTRFFPDKAGRFVGGAIEDGGFYARRKYAAPPSHMEVTISDSRSPSLHLTPRVDHSDFFVRESAAYPQIKTLDIPKGTGSGFYDCVETGHGERCSGYILLYDGFHVEVLNGDATRDDVDTLLAALPMRTLATLR